MPAAAALAPWLTLVQNLSTAARASIDPLDGAAPAGGGVWVIVTRVYEWMWVCHRK